MTSCCDILKEENLPQIMSANSLADSRFPDDLTAIGFDSYVGFPPQRPSPDGGGAEGEIVIR
jgi:hypothetical protein